MFVQRMLLLLLLLCNGWVGVYAEKYTHERGNFVVIFVSESLYAIHISKTVSAILIHNAQKNKICVTTAARNVKGTDDTIFGVR